MNQGAYVFSQLISLVSPTSVKTCVKRYNGVYKTKHFNCWRQYFRMVFGQLTHKWDRFSRNAGDAYQMINTLRKLGVEPQAIEQPLHLSIPENKMILAFYWPIPKWKTTGGH